MSTYEKGEIKMQFIIKAYDEDVELDGVREIRSLDEKL